MVRSRADEYRVATKNRPTPCFRSPVAGRLASDRESDLHVSPSGESFSFDETMVHTHASYRTRIVGGPWRAVLAVASASHLGSPAVRHDGPTGRGALPEVTPVRGHDEEHPRRGERGTCHDRPCPVQSKCGDLRGHEPDASDQDQQEPDFGELQPCRTREAEHAPDSTSPARRGSSALTGSVGARAGHSRAAIPLPACGVASGSPRRTCPPLSPRTQARQQSHARLRALREPADMTSRSPPRVAWIVRQPGEGPG